MNSKNDGPKGAGTDKDPKRPYATIDVKAVEIKTEPVKPGAAQADAGKVDAGKAGAGKADAAASAASTAAPMVKIDLGKAGETAKQDAAKEAGKDAGKWTASGKVEPGKDAKPADPKGTDPRLTEGKSVDTKGTDKAAAAAAAASAAAPAPRRSGIGGFFSHLAAGVVGGFLALLGADTITQKVFPELGLPVPPNAASEATAALQKRVDELAAAAKAAPAGSPDMAAKLAAAEQRLGALDAALKDQQAKAAAEVKAVTDKLAAGGNTDASARVAKLEERLAALVAAAGTQPGNGVPQLAAVTGKMADLEQTVGNQLAAVRKGIAEQIEARVNAVAEAAELAKSGTQRLDKDVSGLKNDTVRLKADSDRLGQSLRTAQEEAATLKSAVDGLRGDLDARIKSTAKPADVSAAVGPVASKLTALENSVASVVKNEDNRRANAERILLSLELGNLKRAVDRGSAFGTELAEVKKSAAGRIDLSALDRFKDKGVAPIAELSREFRAVANAVLDADAEPAGGGVLDRLVAGAKSVVRVRKVSAGADEAGTEAVLARMETALKDARLADVLAEAAKLAPKAATPAHDWLVKVEARNTVDKAIAAVETTLKAALAQVPEGAAPAAPLAPASTPAPPAPVAVPEKK